MLKNTKKDKIVTLSFPKFISFYHLGVPERLRISEIFFVILHTKILIDKSFFIFIRNKKDKKNKQSRQVFLSKQLVL